MRQFFDKLKNHELACLIKKTQIKKGFYVSSLNIYLLIESFSENYFVDLKIYSF